MAISEPASRRPTHKTTPPGHVRTRDCINYREELDLACTGTITFHPGDIQGRCSICGGWEGIDAPDRHHDIVSLAPPA